MLLKVGGRKWVEQAFLTDGFPRPVRLYVLKLSLWGLYLCESLAKNARRPTVGLKHTGRYLGQYSQSLQASTSNLL